MLGHQQQAMRRTRQSALCGNGGIRCLCVNARTRGSNPPSFSELTAALSLGVVLTYAAACYASP